MGHLKPGDWVVREAGDATLLQVVRMSICLVICSWREGGKVKTTKLVPTDLLVVWRGE